MPEEGRHGVCIALNQLLILKLGDAHGAHLNNFRRISALYNANVSEDISANRASVLGDRVHTRSGSTYGSVAGTVWGLLPDCHVGASPSWRLRRLIDCSREAEVQVCTAWAKTQSASLNELSDLQWRASALCILERFCKDVRVVRAQRSCCYHSGNGRKWSRSKREHCRRRVPQWWVVAA